MRAPGKASVNRLFEQGVRGAIGGFVATMPMTALMEFGDRRFLGEDHQALPPREITADLARRVGADHFLTEPGRYGLALGGHFAYGAAAGLPYLVLARRLKGPAPVRGAVYGFALWAASYFGLIPALRLHGSAADQTWRSNVLMAVAHLVWGGALAVTAAALNRQEPGAGVRGLGEAP